jgi:cyclase
MKSLNFRLLALPTLLALVPWCTQAADTPPPAVEAVRLADKVFLLTHTMCNSAALVGDEGVLLIDAGVSADEATQRQAALAKLTAKPVRLLVDTHWHFDHVNGNETFGTAGATIIGHDAMRPRMIEGKTKALAGFPAVTYTNEALAVPTITFDRELTLHFAGEEILLVHPSSGPAHTDGDVVVYFRHANIVHTGDLYFQGLYPFIDVGTGGWIDGMIAANREILARIDDQTVVIPGHGPTTDKAHLAAYVDMLADISAKVTALVKAGKTLDEVRAAKPTAAHDEAWGKLFLKPDQFVEIVYSGIVAHTKK